MHRDRRCRCVNAPTTVMPCSNRLSLLRPPVRRSQRRKPFCLRGLRTDAAQPREAKVTCRLIGKPATDRPTAGNRLIVPRNRSCDHQGSQVTVPLHSTARMATQLFLILPTSTSDRLEFYSGYQANLPSSCWLSISTQKPVESLRGYLDRFASTDAVATDVYRSCSVCRRPPAAKTPQSR